MADSGTEAPKNIDVYELLAICFEQITGIAWVKLGFQPDPVSQSLSIDLVQAKAAIDAASALSTLVESVVSSEDKSQLQTVIRNLKLNYVAKSKEQAELGPAE